MVTYSWIERAGSLDFLTRGPASEPHSRTSDRPPSVYGSQWFTYVLLFHLKKPKVPFNSFKSECQLLHVLLFVANSSFTCLLCLRKRISLSVNLTLQMPITAETGQRLRPATGNSVQLSHMTGMNPNTSTITTASWSLHWCEAGDEK